MEKRKEYLEEEVEETEFFFKCRLCGGYTTKEEFDTAMCCTDCLAVGVATTVAVTTSLLLWLMMFILR